MLNPISPDFSNTPVSTLRPRYAYAPHQINDLPAVTIISPFYNVGTVFHETAQSVLQQSFQQWEWLIINDGSTDPEALAVLAEYRRHDPRIRIIDQPINQGPSAARNTGFREAHSEYIVQVDSDDLLEPTAIEKWLWFLVSQPEYSFVKGYTVGFGAQKYLWQKGFHSRELILQENCIDINSMIRRSVCIDQAVNGYDVSIRDGFEDWDFWLRCASAGYWGATVPEYLNWYRRRLTHADHWKNWDAGTGQQQFRAVLQKKYPRLWNSGFPNIQSRPHLSYEIIPNDLPFSNRLAKTTPRALLILPWMTIGGADKFNLDLVKQLTNRYRYEITIATTLRNDHPWLSSFAACTPDIFILEHFLRLVDYPRFLHYLIQSRQIDTVLVSNSYLGYRLLPYLRAHHPNVTFMDYIHMEEEYWRNGGFPRASLNQSEQLDLTVVSSKHLKDWMVERGGAADRIEVCTTNIKVEDWDPDRYDPTALRHALNIPEDIPVILYAGRLTEQKQPKVFAKVMLQLVHRQNEFISLVAGDGEDRVWLESFLESNKLTCVRMLGSVTNEYMLQLMAVGDIFFLPSTMEGISLAIYEAMAMGVVPVGADVGGQSELVTPDCGFLVQRGSTETEAYVQVLERILADQALRKQMARSARQRVDQYFRLEQMGERMNKLIQRAHELACCAPRPVVPLGLGYEIATHAIEQTRLENLADQLWFERQMLLAQQPTVTTLRPYLAARIAQRLKKTARPIYYWLVRHGMTWLVPVRERLRGKVLDRLTAIDEAPWKQ